MLSNVRRAMLHTKDQASFPLVFFSSFVYSPYKLDRNALSVSMKATLVAGIIWDTSLASLDTPDPVIMTA
jgi:hypothetical protein